MLGALAPLTAQATFIGETVDVTVNDFFGTPISSAATVGAGNELSGTRSSLSYTLDISAGAFTVTISKPFTVGNFTGIFTEISLTNLDYAVNSVVFNAATSSVFSSGDPSSTNLSTPGQIIIDFGNSVFASANTPASALSHSFTWDVQFGDRLQIAQLQTVPVPATLVLLGLGLAGLGWSRRRNS